MVAGGELGCAGFTSAIVEPLASMSGTQAAIDDSPIQMLPLVHVPSAMLAAHGYRPALETEHYVVWLRNDEPDRDHTKRQH